MLKWKGKSGSRTKCNVTSYRKALDSLNPCDVSNNIATYLMIYVEENSKSALVLMHRYSGFLARI